jgi:hypothetical protein
MKTTTHFWWEGWNDAAFFQRNRAGQYAVGSDARREYEKGFRAWFARK